MISSLLLSHFSQKGRRVLSPTGRFIPPTHAKHRIDAFFLCGIIPLASRPTSSMAEQLTLNQQVQGSTPWSVTSRKPDLHRALCHIMLDWFWKNGSQNLMQVGNIITRGCFSIWFGYEFTGNPTCVASTR